MATTSTTISAGIEAVFAVLSNADRYPDWVVGASKVRTADSHFPAAGSRFHHEVGMRPATLSDHTEVVEASPPHRLVLAAKARPLGTATVELELEARGPSATEVTMTETGRDLITRVLLGNPIGERLLRVRNDEALRRLRRLAEANAGAAA